MNFSLDVESTEKRCNVCERPGVYVVTFETIEDWTADEAPMMGRMKVRYCWNCLPAEQRHYLRVNY